MRHDVQEWIWAPVTDLVTSWTNGTIGLRAQTHHGIRETVAYLTFITYGKRCVGRCKKASFLAVMVEDGAGLAEREHVPIEVRVPETSHDSDIEW